MSYSKIVHLISLVLAQDGVTVSAERLAREIEGEVDLREAGARLEASGYPEESGFELHVSAWGLVKHEGRLGEGGAIIVEAPVGLVAGCIEMGAAGPLVRLLDARGLVTAQELGDMSPDAAVMLLRPVQRRRWHDDVGYRADQRYRWFLGHLQAQWRTYVHVLVASAVMSLLAIVAAFYTMNVYDRVVPNNAFSTLWVLTVGIVMVYVFDFILKEVRGVLADSAARRIDVAVSGVLFSKVLNMQLLARPASSGVMAGHLREFEGVRDFFTSLSILVLLDLPFFWLYLAIIFWIGGVAIALVPVVAVPIVLLALWVIQGPMSKAVEGAATTSVQKQGLLIEAINGQLDVKALGAGRVLRRLWDACSIKSAAESNKARYWSSLGVNFSALVQQLVQVGMVVVGVYVIARGDMTMGGLIACSILNGRLMAPLGQAVSLGVRAQQTYQSIQTLSRIMEKPEDRQLGRRYIAPAEITGGIELKNVEFRYRPDDSEPVISGLSLCINEGERVGIIGRSGCGKTTLLKLMAGLMEPQSGGVYLGSRDARQIEPLRLREHIAYVPQAPFLISGTIKENLCMGNPLASDEELLAASHTGVLDDHIASHPQGYDRPVGEAGGLLSGGQRQCLAIARALLGKPSVILLDEPTSAMDVRTEEEFRRRFQEYSRGRTVVLVTHKSSMLEIVDRIIVVDQGRIVSDSTKQQLRAAVTGKAPGVTAVGKGAEHVNPGT